MASLACDGPIGASVVGARLPGDPSLVGGSMGASVVGARLPEGSPVRVDGRIEVIRGRLGDLPISLAVGHCNDDDLLDVLSVNADSTAQWGDRGKSAHPAVYLGRADQTFERLEVPWLSPNQYRAAVFADMDGDGREDVVAASFHVVWLRSLGGCRFAPPEVLMPEGDQLVSSLLVTDANLDGLPDIVLSFYSPTRRPFLVLMGTSGGTYETYVPPTTPFEPAMKTLVPFMAFFDDIDGDGAHDCFSMLDTAQSWFSWGTSVGGGVSLSRDDALTSLIVNSNPMSAAPLDADGDGRMEYFLAGTPGKTLLLRSLGGRRLVNVAPEAGVDGLDETTAWGAYAFDADLDGTSDVLVQRIGDEFVESAIGPVQIYMNRGDGTFADMGASLVNARLRAKAIVCGDLDGAAHRGCFVQSDGGPVLLRVDLQPRGNWVGLRLTGTVSAPPATGARVEMLGGPGPRSYYYGPQAPYRASHDPSLVVAIGDRAEADLQIRWPSGVSQRVTGLSAGRYHAVAEPLVLALSSRSAPADGRSTVDVYAAPGLVGASSATLALQGAGALTSLGLQADGRYRWSVQSPATPGSAVLTLTLDGVALHVRPRLRFTTPP